MEIISRRNAIIQKLTKYYTGKACPNGHISERYVANYNCIACNEIHAKSFHENNPDKKELYMQRKMQDRSDHPEKRKAWRDTNTKSIRLSNKKFQESHPTYFTDYRKNNPDIISKHRLKRRTCKKQASPSWYEKEQISTLYQKRDELSKLWGIQLHVDHIVPLQGKNVCGLHCLDNLQLIEAKLNQKKYNKFKG